MERLVEPDFNCFIPSILLAVVLAINSFSYLHSRKKTDFYLSLPIKRNTQFFLEIVASSLIYLIPSVVELLLKVVIVLPTGYISNIFFTNLMWSFLCNCLVFAMVWITMTLMMVMTGHLVIAVFGFCMACAYVPLLLYELYPTLAGLFFDTFYNVRQSEMPWYFFSPISLAGCLGDNYDLRMEKFYIYLMAALLFLVVTGFLAWRLYRKRAAEAAGKAIAFSKMSSMVRWLVVVPIGLYFGYFLETMSGMDSKVWLVAGTIIGVVLVHGLIESIYEFDLKCMLAKKKQLAAELILCLSVLAGFYFTADIYNGYLPGTEEVESIKFVLLDDNVRLYDAGNMEGVHEEQVQPVISLVEQIIRQNGERSEEGSEENDAALGTVYIKYKMKDGKIKGRTYCLDTGNEENRKLLDRIVGTEDFKEDFFEIFVAPDEVVKEITIDNSFETQSLWLPEEEKAELLNIYRKELAELTYTEMKQGIRYAQICFQYEYEYAGSYSDNTCYIYDNFDETIAFLEKYGISVENPMKHCQVLTVDFEERYDETGTIVYEINEPEVIAEVAETFTPVDLYGPGYVDRPENGEYVRAEVKIGEHIEKRYFYVGAAEADFLIKSVNGY